MMPMQMMPPGGPPQMPPQGMGAFQQAAQPPRPPMPPMAGASPTQPGQPPQGQQQMNPQVIMQMIQTLPPQIQQILAQQILKSAASQGRGGDTMLAHLTPGEKTVPPEVQTPKVLATLNKAYKEKGVQPQQFTAGTPQSSHNPSTGLPEYNFKSAFLPAALGIAGAALAPMTGGASLGLSSAAMGAIGGGLGTTVGGLLSGQSPTQAALSGLGSGAGGYLLGGLGGAAGAGPSAGENALAQSAQASAGQPLTNLPGMAASSAAHAPIFGSQMLGNAVGNFNPLSSAGSALGGYIGGSLGATPKSNGPKYPDGFNDPMPQVGSLGSAQQQLGMNNSNQPMPQFGGYNPATNNPAAYNFFPRG